MSILSRHTNKRISPRIPLLGLVGFVVIASILLTQATTQTVKAAEAPNVKLTNQEILPLPSKNTRLIWLEINSGEYKVESLNHHPLPLQGPDCREDMVFSPRLSGDRFQRGQPLVFSWAMRADIQWICLEMVVSKPPSPATHKLYAALQIIKPVVKVTDRPTVEITSRHKISAHQKIIWLEITSNGYDVKKIDYHPIPLSDPDCHKDMGFSSLLKEDQLAGRQELNMSLAISSKSSYFCALVVYADNSGQIAPHLYLSIPVEEVNEPTQADFVAQSGTASQPLPDTTPPPSTKPEPMNTTNNDNSSGTDDPKPAGDNSETASVAETGTDDESETTEKAGSQAQQSDTDGNATDTGKEDGLTRFGVLAFLTAGAIALASLIFFKRTKR